MTSEEREISTLPAPPSASEYSEYNESSDSPKLNDLLFMTHEILRIRTQIQELESQPEKNKDAIKFQNRALKRYGEEYKKMLKDPIIDKDEFSDLREAFFWLLSKITKKG